MDDAPLDAVWRALSDPTRRDLLDGLRDGPRTTGELAARVPGLTRFAVMKHLGVLKDAGLIIPTREGRKRFNHLNAVPLRRIYERWVSKYQDRWAGSLLSLQRLVEREGHKETDMESTTVQSFAFTVAMEIAAEPGAVYAAWFDRCAEWFYESEASRAQQRAVIERAVGGRFYLENTAGPKAGKTNLLAHVTMLEPGRKLRLRGDFTMPQALLCNCTVTFEPAGSGCRVSIEQRMMGECDRAMSADFRDGWLDSLTKLRALLEG